MQLLDGGDTQNDVHTMDALGHDTDVIPATQNRTGCCGAYGPTVSLSYEIIEAHMQGRKAHSWPGMPRAYEHTMQKRCVRFVYPASPCDCRAETRTHRVHHESDKSRFMDEVPCLLHHLPAREDGPRTWKFSFP